MSGLAITRHIGESFEIGNHVKVTVTQIKGGQVRLSVVAPREIAVHRSEIANRIRAENGGVIPGQEAT